MMDNLVISIFGAIEVHDYTRHNLVRNFAISCTFVRIQHICDTYFFYSFELSHHLLASRQPDLAIASSNSIRSPIPSC